ncbi:hypothetical protein LCGC14_0599780 [marine sediment metagenome]|uniref:Uncharacterized protein n=1 Tax=marine sediment metagenome TaxID=412755 RepID=A0A0F9UJD1_9ZZZZ
MTMLKVGEKLVKCEVCEHETIVPMKEAVRLRPCERCEHPALKVVKVKPTNIHGLGRNKTADLGLAILVDMLPDDCPDDILENS